MSVGLLGRLGGAVLSPIPPDATSDHGPLTSPAPRAIGVGPPQRESMDEPALRAMLAQVKHGGLTPRGFVQALAAAGLCAPMSGRLLGAPGEAGPQPRA